MLDPQDASNLTGMDLVLHENQKILRESARAFVKKNGGPAAFRANSAQEANFDRGRLEAVAAQGWFRLLVSPSRKGLGLGLTELALVMEA
ncbi:MAG: acyl-CoA dehydrogenase family protein, partial [Pseudomonadota bacterium]|nr:acyl-CoA dehydrogenase family protein [Pseudomonadota bacterium]